MERVNRVGRTCRSLEVLGVITPVVRKGQVVLELEDGDGVGDLEADYLQVEVIGLRYDALEKTVPARMLFSLLMLPLPTLRSPTDF